MRNHAIYILEKEQEDLLKSLKCTSMTSIIKEDIENVKLAIHNLKMLDEIQ